MIVEKISISLSSHLVVLRKITFSLVPQDLLDAPQINGLPALPAAGGLPLTLERRLHRRASNVS